jgi:hypothetical protein
LGLRVKNEELMSENSPKPRRVEDDELVRELVASGASLSEIATRAEAASKAPTEHESSVNKITEHNAEVRVGRYGDISECDVVVAFHGQEMSLRCRDYDQAVKWARIECRSYKIDGGFTVEG